MKILVPDSIYSELVAPALAAAPDAELLPYQEDSVQALPGQGEAVGILRWIAGKGYARLINDCANIRWLHTASAGVNHVPDSGGDGQSRPHRDRFRPGL